MRRADAAERVRASGFPAKMRAYFTRSKEWFRAPGPGRNPNLPKSARAFARTITALGEPCGPSAVASWERGVSLPEARYIGPIEALFVAPWAYLDRPDTEWPPKESDTLTAFAAALSFAVRGGAESVAARIRRASSRQ